MSRNRDNRQTETDTIIQEMLTLVIELLTGRDDDRRKEAIAQVQQTAVSRIRFLVIDRLVDSLRKGGEAVRDRAAASLVDLGEAAVPALAQRLLNTTSAALQAHLVDLLRQIGIALPFARRVPIQMELDIAYGKARSPEVLLAIARAQSQLRPPFAGCTSPGHSRC